MQPLLAAVQPFTMQHRIHVACENGPRAVALLPRATKPVGVVAAAEEARPMSGRECRRLVEKEQFGPAPTTHHLAPPSPELAKAGDPCGRRPALPEQRPGGGIV